MDKHQVGQCLDVISLSPTGQASRAICISWPIPPGTLQLPGSPRKIHWYLSGLEMTFPRGQGAGGASCFSENCMFSPESQGEGTPLRVTLTPPCLLHSTSNKHWLQVCSGQGALPQTGNAAMRGKVVRGAWVAQSVKCLTSAQVMISQSMSSSPASGSVLTAWSLFQIMCLPLSLDLPRSCSVSLCLKNK